MVPSAGPVAGGTTVVLTGTNLSGATAVNFGAAPAISFTVNSATQITAVAPAGTGTVQVTVTTAGGTSNGVSYTYVAVPTLTVLVPNLGPVTGGTTVVLTGTNLTGATAVNFGATPAISFTVNSATQITAVAPAGTGTVQVTVTTAG
ncbi:IPT/TIG domain-containing protein, partial [Nocardia vinacea]|uniref:IPT/TIG domain-containing protein n=1 Tax=Nocardia vinacea TaxID=96468 RepID=UPI003417F14F